MSRYRGGASQLGGRGVSGPIGTDVSTTAAALRSHAAWREEQRQKRLLQEEAARARAHELQVGQQQISGQQQQLIMDANLESRLRAEQAYGQDLRESERRRSDERSQRRSRLRARGDAVFAQNQQMEYEDYAQRLNRENQRLAHEYGQQDARQKFGFDSRLAGQQGDIDYRLGGQKSRFDLERQGLVNRGQYDVAGVQSDLGRYQAELQARQQGASDRSRERIGAASNDAALRQQALVSDSYGDVARIKDEGDTLRQIIGAVNPADPAAQIRLRNLTHQMNTLQNTKRGIQAAMKDGDIDSREGNRQLQGVSEREDQLYEQLEMFDSPQQQPFQETVQQFDPDRPDMEVYKSFGPDGKMTVHDLRQSGRGTAAAPERYAPSPLPNVPVDRFHKMVLEGMSDAVLDATDENIITPAVTYSESYDNLVRLYGQKPEPPSMQAPPTYPGSPYGPPRAQPGYVAPASPAPGGMPAPAPVPGTPPPPPLGARPAPDPQYTPEVMQMLRRAENPYDVGMSPQAQNPILSGFNVGGSALFPQATSSQVPPQAPVQDPDQRIQATPEQELEFRQRQEQLMGTEEFRQAARSTEGKRLIEELMNLERRGIGREHRGGVITKDLYDRMADLYSKIQELGQPFSQKATNVRPSFAPGGIRFEAPRLEKYR